MNLLKETIKDIRDYILTDVKREIAVNNLHPRLVIIQTNGYDDASNIYVKNKIKTCESVGIKCELIKKHFDVFSLLSTIEKLSHDDTVDGIILQLPFSENLKGFERIILDSIPWYKDIDGLSTESIGRLWTNKDCIYPATASAVCKLIDYNFPTGLNFKKVSIINRSYLIGKPLMKMLLDRNATIEVLHSKSNPADIRCAFNMSDIVITGVGNTSLADCFDEQVYWIDCGINRDAENHVCGDAGYLKSNLISPVPCGIGTLTTACVCENVLKAVR